MLANLQKNKHLPWFSVWFGCSTVPLESCWEREARALPSSWPRMELFQKPARASAGAFHHRVACRDPGGLAAQQHHRDRLSPILMFVCVRTISPNKYVFAPCLHHMSMFMLIYVYFYRKFSVCIQLRFTELLPNCPVRIQSRNWYSVINQQREQKKKNIVRCVFITPKYTLTFYLRNFVLKLLLVNPKNYTAGIQNMNQSATTEVMKSLWRAFKVSLWT